ncbi:hypothetical protein, partial [Veillonella tobetsuensis]|uniref:hypothetical protein n=1 Tax=Veillonella tobetsuensis TaxID=1110546 RepID=UPI001BB0F252
FGGRHRAGMGFGAFQQGGSHVHADLQVAEAADHIRVFAFLDMAAGAVQQLGRKVQCGQG